MIDFVLDDNPLTKDNPNDRRARVVNQRTYTEVDLAEAIAGRNIGISKLESLAGLEAQAEFIMKWVAEGNTVNLRTAHYHFSIPGVYEEDEYPKEAVIRITPSKELAEIAKKVPLRHVEPVAPMRINFIHDVKSNTTNDKVTRGGTVKISGHNLKIMGKEGVAVGAEFISREDPDAIYPIPAVDVIVNNPSELIVIAPQMVAGEPVVFRVTTQYTSGGTLLKAPRSFTFEKELTVV